jgi:hypothetical protein
VKEEPCPGAEPLLILPVAEIDLGDPAVAVVDLLMEIATVSSGQAVAVRMPVAQAQDVARRLAEACDIYLGLGEPGESFRLLVRPWPNGWADLALVYDDAEVTEFPELQRWWP